LEVSDPEELRSRFQSDYTVKDALVEGIANGLPGVEPDMVSILDLVVSSSRRLGVARLLAASVDLIYELMVPETIAQSVGLDAQKVVASSGSVATSLNESLATKTTLHMVVKGTTISEPTVEVMASASTTTMTTTTTTYTAAVVTMVGTITFAYPNCTVVQAKRATEGTIVKAMGLSLDQFWVTMLKTRRLSQEDEKEAEEGRRLVGFAWIATWKATLVPSEAVGLVLTAAALMLSDLREILADSLVVTGSTRADVDVFYDLRVYDVPRVSSTDGPPVTDACGADFCPANESLTMREFAPEAICAGSLSCADAQAVCCEAPIAQKMTTSKPQDSAAAAGIVAGVLGGLFLIAVLVAIGVFVYRRRKHNQKKQEHASRVVYRNSSRVMDDNLLHGIAPRPKAPPLVLEGDEKVVTKLLNDLVGEWRLYDGDMLLPGLVEIREDGYSLYDGSHWEDQDLVAEAHGITRRDGWCVDMNLSDTDQLEWIKDGESGIMWKRCKGISGFAIGDTVEWTEPNTTNPERVQGTVIGFTDTRVRVQLEDGELLDSKPSELDILRKANQVGGQPEVGSAARSLPCLALCLEFKRLNMYAEIISRENTNLATQNDELRSELTNRSQRLERENSQLKSQLGLSHDLQRELTNTLSASREMTELSAHNQRLQAQVQRASEMERELTEMSVQNDRLANQLRFVPGSPSSAAGGRDDDPGLGPGVVPRGRTLVEDGYGTLLARDDTDEEDPYNPYTEASDDDGDLDARNWLAI